MLATARPSCYRLLHYKAQQTLHKITNITHKMIKADKTIYLLKTNKTLESCPRWRIEVSPTAFRTETLTRSKDVRI